MKKPDDGRFVENVTIEPLLLQNIVSEMLTFVTVPEVGGCNSGIATWYPKNISPFGSMTSPLALPVTLVVTTVWLHGGTGTGHCAWKQFVISL